MAKDFCEWLDAYTCYRTRREIADAFSRTFTAVEYIEHDFVRYRLQRSRALVHVRFLADIPAACSILAMAYRRLGGAVIRAIE